jgi:hypothetical protein
MRSNKFATRVFFGMLLATVLNYPAFCQTRGRVEGVVMQGKAPVEYVYVGFDGEGLHLRDAAITDANGRFRVEDLGSGSYKLSFKRPGFEPTEVDVRIVAGGTSEVAVQIGPEKYVSGCEKQDIRPEIPNDLSTVRIFLERTPGCMTGGCPSYSVSIYGDRRIVYQGNEYAEIAGRRTHQIARSKVKQLIDEFYRIDFLGFCGDYGLNVTDSGGAKTSIQVGEYKKTVSNDDSAGPNSLQSLEAEIDKIAGTSRRANKLVH